MTETAPSPRPSLYIDADACPVRGEAQRVAERHRIRMVVVSNGGIRPVSSPFVETVIVAEGADAADQWIAERIAPGDICITADIPLAAKCLEAGGAALRPNGEPFTQANIGQLLGMRDLMADLRAANPLGAGGGGKPFSKADRSRFLDVLERMVRSAVSKAQRPR
ncbi:MAG: YaiI/YqxD family protein [Pseudomonadota bacterium]